MSTGSSSQPNTIDALALLPLPPLDALTEQQVRGTACIWDGVPLVPGIAVDLGPREAARAGSPLQWYPRACRKCVQVQALRALHEHAPSCEQCVDNAGECETGMALIRLERGFRR